MTALVPSAYHLSINNVDYMLDRASQQFTGPTSVKLQREQSDAADIPGEQTLNRGDLWRRSQDNWVGGCGQKHLDSSTSDPRRFWKSRGVNCWNDNELSMLNHVDSYLGATSLPTPILEVADTYLYATTGTGTGTSYTSDGINWTANTGGSGTVAGICSDGQYVYVADAGGIRRTAPGTTALGAVWNTHVPTLMQFVKGRIMTAIGAAIYNVVSSTAPSALYTHGNSSWRWVGFAEGPTHIFAAGYVGDKSYIYRIPVKSDGTGLDAPLVAGELPDGEIVTTIKSYLGFLFIGTNKGFRVAEATTDLIIGPLVDIDQPVYCFEGQGKFVWFGWSDFEGYTGLGRVDLSKFTGPLTPAYATDLMFQADPPTAVNIPETRAVVTFNGKLHFGVSYSGYWLEVDYKVPSAYIDFGWVGFGLADTKILDRVTVRHQPLRGAIRASIITHSGATYVGEVSDTGMTLFDTGEIESRSTRHRLVLDFDPYLDDQSYGPVVDRVTLHALPQVRRGTEWFLPLRIADSIIGVDGVERAHDPISDISNITSLADSPFDPLVTMVIGTQTYRVWVEDYQFIGDKPTEINQIWQGTLLVRVKAPAAADSGGPGPSSYLGSGRDGDVTLTSGTTTLTRDMEYASLNVDFAATLRPNGYIIRVQGLCTINGAVSNNGTDGTATAGGAGGAGGTLPRGGHGGAPGISTSTAGRQGEYAASMPGGNGGDGYQGAGGAATVQSNTPINHPALVGYLPELASGGGGGGLYSGGTGSGGGGGGGCIVIFADTIVYNGAMEATGGGGGVTVNGAAGAGGGGGGGFIGLYYVTSLTDLGSTNVQYGPGGANGASANDGSDGFDGQYVTAQIS